MPDFCNEKIISLLAEERDLIVENIENSNYDMENGISNCTVICASFVGGKDE